MPLQVKVLTSICSRQNRDLNILHRVVDQMDTAIFGEKRQFGESPSRIFIDSLNDEVRIYFQTYRLKYSLKEPGMCVFMITDVGPNIKKYLTDYFLKQ